MELVNVECLGPGHYCYPHWADQWDTLLTGDVPGRPISCSPSSLGSGQRTCVGNKAQQSRENGDWRKVLTADGSESGNPGQDKFGTNQKSRPFLL